MIKVPAYTPITSDVNKRNLSLLLTSFFYYGRTRFLITGKSNTGQLILKKVQAPQEVAQRGLKPDWLPISRLVFISNRDL